MRGKQMPLIEEAPVIAIGLVVASAGALAYAAVLGAARLGLRLASLGRKEQPRHR